ncbi:TIGR02449 family protein [Endozoicomonadaceae bacterium StTr2]
MGEDDITGLARRIDQLIELCDQLRQENRLLRSSEQAWKSERAQLIEKNELARTKVEAMISRLKALEQET